MTDVLIIDDDKKICKVLSGMVESLGHKAFAANTLEDGLRLAKTGDYDLILLDLEFPGGNGLKILPELLKVPSLPEVIIITGTGGITGAEAAYKYGAWDYVQKPFLLNEVSLPITRALQYRKEKETGKIPVTLKRPGIIGESAPICQCLEEMAKASTTDAGVLISGETGTGKELFAKAIHENSKRSSGEFMVVDCGALPETLAESVLFGHEKGAFTGAEKKRDGLVKLAEGGTLFLDEIGDLPLNIQKSLLRTLQEHTIRPIGGETEVPVNFRLVSATNRDLDKMVKENRFREDFLYRIRAVEINLPPLRERENDIQEITLRKIYELGSRYNIGTKGVSPDFFQALNSCKWPGNVRELVNVLEYAIGAVQDYPTLFPKHLPPEYRTALLKTSAKQRKRQKP